MSSYLFGSVHETQQPFHIPESSFDTHWHLIGGTGKGKTTAIHTILHELLLDPFNEPCVFIIDRMGNLSLELLLWMASEYCTDSVRQRLVYIEPARENVVLPFNPLLYETPGEGYYKVSRAAEIILRGWASQNLEEMPRLARWLFNSFYACALLGLTIADSVHLLLPGSPYHRLLLDCLPEVLKNEWNELIRSKSAEVSRQLESTRNRLKPFFDCPNLRLMFGSVENKLDALRFMREGKIVLINLHPGGVIPEQIADAIGGLVINELLTTARSLPFGTRYPTFLFLDEFQRFVGPDIEAAIPETRQLGMKLILSHQSLSQLERGDTDLESMIFQCQSRMIFGVQGQDADLLAHELASITYDPNRIKEELYSRRQRLTGHRIVELQSRAFAQQEAANWMKNFGNSWSTHENLVRGKGLPVRGEGSGTTRQEGEGRGGSSGRTTTIGSHEQLVPVHEDFLELMSRTYVSFEEWRNVWARDIRNKVRGTAFLRLVDDPSLYNIDVKRSAPGHLEWDAPTLAQFFPQAIEEMHRMLDQNFQSEWFVSPHVIEHESQKRIERVARPAITLQTQQPAPEKIREAPPQKNPML